MSAQQLRIFAGELSSLPHGVPAEYRLAVSEIVLRAYTDAFNQQAAQQGSAEVAVLQVIKPHDTSPSVGGVEGGSSAPAFPTVDGSADTAAATSPGSTVGDRSPGWLGRHLGDPIGGVVREIPDWGERISSALGFTRSES